MDQSPGVGCSYSSSQTRQTQARIYLNKTRSVLAVTPRNVSLKGHPPIIGNYEGDNCMIHLRSLGFFILNLLQEKYIYNNICTSFLINNQNSKDLELIKIDLSPITVFKQEITGHNRS